MAADVVEGAKLGIVATNYNDRLAGDIGGEELAFFANLIEPTHDLPGRAENAGAFEFFDTRVAIPGRGNREGSFESIGRIVEIEEVVDGSLHYCSWDRARSNDFAGIGTSTSYREIGLGESRK